MIICTVSSLSFAQKSAVSPLASARLFAFFRRGGSSSQFKIIHLLFFFFCLQISRREFTHFLPRAGLLQLSTVTRGFPFADSSFGFVFLSIRVSDHSSTRAKLPCTDVAFVFLVDRPPFISRRIGMGPIRCDANEAI